MSEDPLGARAGRRPPWSAFRAALDAAGFRPSKTLGQNFLIDPNAARSIALDAGLAPGSRVLEVGAGCGFLTLFLAELGLDCLAVEIDERLLAVARRLLAAYPNVRWLHVDALAGKHALAPRLVAELPAHGAWHVVSNLPYSIAAPLLVLLARLENPPASMTVLIQEELAQRIAAAPGDSEWGPLSARLRLSYEARAGRRVGAQLFWPRPRVASRVLALGRNSAPPRPPDELRAFDELVDAVFQQRRKQLAASLGAALGQRAHAQALLAAAGVAADARPEDLGPERLLEMARHSLWVERPGIRPSRGEETRPKA